MPCVGVSREHLMARGVCLGVCSRLFRPPRFGDPIRSFRNGLLDHPPTPRDSSLLPSPKSAFTPRGREGRHPKETRGRAPPRPSLLAGAGMLPSRRRNGRGSRYGQDLLRVVGAAGDGAGQ